MPAPLRELLKAVAPIPFLLRGSPAQAPFPGVKLRWPKPDRGLTPDQGPGVLSALKPSPQPQQATNRCCACRKPAKKRRKKRECVKSVTRDRFTGRFA